MAKAPRGPLGFVCGARDRPVPVPVCQCPVPLSSRFQVPGCVRARSCSALAASPSRASGHPWGKEPRCGARAVPGAGAAAWQGVGSARVCRRRDGGSRDFSASHSSERDINNPSYFRLLLVKLWRSLAASRDAWCLRCVLGGTAQGGHSSPLVSALFFFPSKVPIVLWDVQGPWLSSRCFGGASCCLVLFAGCSYPELEAWPCWVPCRDEGTLLPKQLPVFRLKWLRLDRASQSKKLRLFFLANRWRKSPELLIFREG